MRNSHWKHVAHALLRAAFALLRTRSLFSAARDVPQRDRSPHLRNPRKTDRDPICLIASSSPVWRRGLAAFARLMNPRKTDRDPLRLIAGSSPVWRRGLAAFALLKNPRKTDRDPLCLIASSSPVWRRGLAAFALLSAAAILTACSSPSQKQSGEYKAEKAPPVYFKVDPHTSGVIKGAIAFTGKKPARTPIDMSGEPACVEARHSRAFDESVVVNPNGTLANVFVYIKSGLEDKTFEPPAATVTIDQKGCWFHPRVMGIQVGQVFHVTNSDPVTHNIHPLAQINREWNHSQGAGDPQLTRKFVKPEVMVPVKCNIHSWMHAFIGVLPHSYFAVSNDKGSFELPNVPSGSYVVAAWHEKYGTQEQNITLSQSGTSEVTFTFKGE